MFKDTIGFKMNHEWKDLELFQKTKWFQLPFGDIVDNVNERVSPADASDEIYVGLEHLDSNDLHIHRWGKGSDVVGTKLRFIKGDIIFGRRRAYQRKLAVAEFDGICSAHAMVVRAKNDIVLSEFLPFLMMSDRFMHRAIEISVGSLSPTINWKTLKQEEFVIPSIDQQKHIADILWTIDELVQIIINTIEISYSLLNAEREEIFDNYISKSCISLNNLLIGSPESGSSAPPSPKETGHYVLSLSALSKIGYVSGNLKPIQPTKVMLKSRLYHNDFLISRSNTQELVGLVGIFNEDRTDISFPDTMMRLPVNEDIILKPFLEAFLQSRRGRLHMMKSAAGTSGSMKKINRKTLGNCLVPTPSIEIQLSSLQKWNKIIGIIKCQQNELQSTNNLKNCIINSLFGNL